MKNEVVVLNQKDIFESFDLVNLGLNKEDYDAVLTAHKELESVTPATIGSYGSGLSGKTSAYTDELLTLVRNKDLDETGQKLNEIVVTAQKLNANNLLKQSKISRIPVIGSLFGKIKNSKELFAQSFNTTKEQIDKIVGEVEVSQNGLKQRIHTLENMFVGVEDEYKQLGVYVAAGLIKQQEIQAQIKTLTEGEQDQLTTQKIFELNSMANNLEKRVSDLKVLQHSAQQTLPMIRIIQGNNSMLVDKFDAIKNITIPAWRNQISLTITLQEQKNSVELAKNIDDATNDLLRRNAELLHQNSVDTARANQRSVIDIETLEHVQNTLIKTVNDVIQIQKEGMKQRDDAELRLKALKNNLSNLVLESSKPDN